MHVNLVWGGFVDTNDPGGGFEDDMVLVGRLTVPANATGTTNRGVISVVEHVDPSDAAHRVGVALGLRFPRIRA